VQTAGKSRDTKTRGRTRRVRDEHIRHANDKQDDIIQYVQRKNTSRMRRVDDCCNNVFVRYDDSDDTNIRVAVFHSTRDTTST